MSVTPDGFLDWAIKMPGRPTQGSGFNPGINGVKGLVFHSAEGWATTMLDPQSQWGYYSAEFPWHLSNLLDGRLIQHYPFTARCWHGSAFNQDYVGMEHEGVGSSSGLLNAGQVANAKRVIDDLSKWKGWGVRRPSKTNDLTATLYEHRETVWFGGTSTSCPNNRIPWDLILAQEADMATENYEGELLERRSRELLAWLLYTGGVKVGYAPSGAGLMLTPKDGAPVGLPVPIPDWAKPS